MRLLGLRLKRHVFAKEVIINDPDYANDTIVLKQMNADIDAYSKEHRLVSAPNIIDVFFKYKKDNEIERISEVLESVIEDLANTKDKILLHEMNKYPILATKAHTRPFEHKWLNIIAGVLVFGMSVSLYAIIAVYVTALVTDTVLEGTKQARAVWIISDKNEQIAPVVMEKMHRGITQFPASGVYTQQEKSVLLCVVSIKQIPYLKEIVMEIDENSFLIVGDVREVMGNGFVQKLQ